MKPSAAKGVGGLVWLSITILFSLLSFSCSQPEPIRIVPPQPSATPQPTPTPMPILVYISGHVKMPDVYTLQPGSRIKQLVEAAGGFTEEANTAALNLAQPLADGAHVHIPALGEEATAQPLVTEPTPLQRSGDALLGAGGGLLNINTAQQQELEQLPGIGPVTAEKIINYRQSNGSFGRIEAIMEVSGIGEGKFNQIKDLITVGN